VELVAEGDTVVARFTCSAPTPVSGSDTPDPSPIPSDADVYFFGFTENRISRAWELGIHPSTAPPTRARPTPSPRVLNRQNHELFRGGTDLSRMPSSGTA